MLAKVKMAINKSIEDRAEKDEKHLLIHTVDY
jgi:hypothetical protein